MAEKSAAESPSSRPVQTGKSTAQPEQTGSKQGTALQRRSTSGRLALPFGPSPFSLVRRMMEDMDRLFEQAGGGLSFAESGLQRSGLPVWSPAVEVVERQGQLVVRADLPGLKQEDVRIEATDDSLVIEGERRSELEVEEEGGIYRSERSYGRFSRTIPLPEGADVQGAQAKFENGVLEVTVPLREQPGRRRIEIQGASSGQGKKAEGPVH